MLHVYLTGLVPVGETADGTTIQKLMEVWLNQSECSCSTRQPIGSVIILFLFFMFLVPFTRTSLLSRFLSQLTRDVRATLLRRCFGQNRQKKTI